jgi:CcmD family protein
MQADNFTFLTAGLVVAWLILFAYVALLAARSRGLQRQIANLKQMLDQTKEH